MKSISLVRRHVGAGEGSLMLLASTSTGNTPVTPNGDVELTSLLPDAWATTHPDVIRSYRAHEREAQAVAKRARRQRRRALERARVKDA